ncbi:MAG: hypothetical protein O6952_05780 [Planctomycetota bacterium]|nr:hypothetical protein [Planctomycetota bacterium]
MEDAKKRGPSTPLDLSGVQSRPLAECRHLVRLEDFARPVDLDASAAEFLDSLPRILAGNRLRDLATAMARAHRESRSIIFAMGGHVVKVGMSPLIIDLMQRGLISALAVNGSFAIHDMEIALIGRTSERIEEVLPEGLFGMARETAEGFARAAAAAARDGSGLGAALGNEVKDAPHHGASVLAAAVRHEVPITVHVAIGTDTVHMHPGLSGADLGEASLTDFRILAGAARRLAGGVWVNVGSAVILPEVFLKVVSVLRNLGEDMDGITAADLDFVRHYRPEVNVMSRPASKGISLTGHHEILLPLLRLALLKELEST